MTGIFVEPFQSLYGIYNSWITVYAISLLTLCPLKVFYSRGLKNMYYLISNFS